MSPLPLAHRHAQNLGIRDRHGHLDLREFHHGLLDTFLVKLGWVEALDKPRESKKAQVLELLNEFPGLVVVDDIDSLEGEDEEALEFFSFAAPNTRSKFLLTSRRVVFGMGAATTQVRGLPPGDCEQLIRSRCSLMGLDFERLKEGELRDIHEVTEGSPLYIEDLLRLATVVPPSEAISAWRGRKGDDARSYALGRELELLSSDAREVIVAASVSESAVSLPELEVLTGVSQDRVGAAIGELQKLYLLPRPQVVEGDYRFGVNVNLRRLVTRVFAKSELLRRVTAAKRSLDSQGSPRAQDQVEPLIRQALLYHRKGDVEAAEKLLVRGLERFPNNAALLGYLGFVYKACVPPRTTDARERFQRAAQLKNSDPEMYLHWSRMEADAAEWSNGIKAAETGIALEGQKENARLLQQAGYCHSRLGQELLGSLNTQRGRQELESAVAILSRAWAIRDYRGDTRLRSRIYRSLVLSLDRLADNARTREYLRLWREELPDDPFQKQEFMRLGQGLSH